MLSYRHAYHAGNFADVHKHCLLVLALRSLLAKPKPIAYHDTHAGRGSYDLRAAAAQHNREFETGLNRLRASSEPPGPVADYLALVEDFERIRPGHYPGLPMLARALMRDGDRGVLMELHGKEAPALRAQFRDDPRFGVHNRDGYEGMVAMLPPAERRGLVLIDPSYEIKTEYTALPAHLRRAWQRWSGGCYLIWYPLLAAGAEHRLRRALAGSGVGRVLDTWIQVDSPAQSNMYGCGMLLINPPWPVQQQWPAVNRWLADTLAREPALAAANTDWLVTGTGSVSVSR